MTNFSKEALFLGGKIIVACNNCNEAGLVPSQWFEDRKPPYIVCQHCGDGRMLPPTTLEPLTQALNGLSSIKN